MSSGFSDIIKQGCVKIRSRHFRIYQKCWLVMKRASSEGPDMLEKYSNQRSTSTKSPQKVMSLTNVKNVSRVPKQQKKHAVMLEFREESSLTFACKSEAEADEWYNVLHIYCIQERKKKLDFVQYHVFPLPSDSFTAHGECTLQITHKAIHLYNAHDPRQRIASWPLKVLRRYGRDRTCFTIEAGRMCDTGEGLFKFHTPEGEAIYQRVHTAVLAIMESQCSHPVRTQND
ncbi:docking protein 5-like isoform X2 [Colossoma macropomum]|uniref:docking protein 5-like isoform X2 n=1 Tax=Colossoma macropomum TaxID=42526 RepID=UPI001864ED7A|nr:docking protein 5-like isoform X2 [Colossoma macropomum]